MTWLPDKAAFLSLPEGMWNHLEDYADYKNSQGNIDNKEYVVNEIMTYINAYAV